MTAILHRHALGRSNLCSLDPKLKRWFTVWILLEHSLFVYIHMLFGVGSGGFDNGPI